jgi:hypothetical protein
MEIYFVVGRKRQKQQQNQGVEEWVTKNHDLPGFDIHVYENKGRYNVI